MSDPEHPEEAYYDALDECSKENARLREALEEIERWPGNYGENASSRARHALAGEEASS